MIIEQHIPTPKGYLSARVVTFRGDPAEEADGPEEKAIGARVEPAWERFIGHVLTFRGPFTSGDIPGFSVAKASRYMTRAVQRGVIRKLGTDHPGFCVQSVATGRPKNLYEVAR